jgi:hypothetical protein
MTFQVSTLFPSLDRSQSATFPTDSKSSTNRFHSSSRAGPRQPAVTTSTKSSPNTWSGATWRSGSFHPFHRTPKTWRRQSNGTYAETIHRSGKIEPVALPGVIVDLDALFA